MSEHGHSEQSLGQGAGSDSFYAPMSILIAAVILSGTLLYVGSDIGGKISLISGKLQAQPAGAGTGTGTGAGTGSGTGSGAQPATVEFKDLVADSPSIGSADAPVTIVMFSDFSCPFCAASDGYNKEVMDYLKGNDPSWVPPVPNILKNEVASGEVRFVTKYFPGHGSGAAAHKVGWCTYEQNPDFFWKYHDLAFENQADTGDVGKMAALAKQAGADEAKLKACLDSKKYDSRLTSETALGRAVGLRGTPLFLINSLDNTLEGAYGYEDLKKAVEAAASKA